MTNKTIITIHPIDWKLMEKAGIKDSSSIKSISVGKTMHTLLTAGYEDIHTFVADDNIHLHFKKDMK